VLALLSGSRPRARRLFQEFVAGSAAGRYDPADARLGAVFGGDDFVRTALAGAGREELLRRTLTPERVAALVGPREGVTLAELAGPGRQRALSRVRSICALLGRDVGRVSLARTARLFRRDPSTISRDVAHLERRLAADPEEARRVGDLRRLLEG
jgi:chromosomal replication initiation ATPase DnaA